MVANNGDCDEVFKSDSGTTLYEVPTLTGLTVSSKMATSITVSYSSSAPGGETKLLVFSTAVTVTDVNTISATKEVTTGTMKTHEWGDMETGNTYYVGMVATNADDKESTFRTTSAKASYHDPTVSIASLVRGDNNTKVTLTYSASASGGDVKLLRSTSAVTEAIVTSST
jgi:hypothetical protein